MHISICAILTTHSLVSLVSLVSLLGSLLICFCALSGSCVCWKYYHIFCTVRFADLQLFYMYFFCVSSFDFQFYLYSTFIALSPELCRFNICLTPVTKKQILSGHSCKYSNPNGSSPKSRRKNVCRLPNPNRQVRKGLGGNKHPFPRSSPSSHNKKTYTNAKWMAMSPRR